MRTASWVQPTLGALLAAAIWLATVEATGFHFSPDSMSYAALARGFLAGRPFTGTILWRTALPGRLQAIWPPLYPSLIALLHTLGARLPVAEFLWSGLANIVAAVPWALTREALLLPVACVVLWHGAGAAAAGGRHPQVAASLDGPWCAPGPRGDCSLFAWLSRHTTNADLIIGNAPFTIDFQLGRTTEEVAPYPYNPRPTAASLRAWRARWLAVHPRGLAYLVLDAVTGPIGARSAYGRLFVRLWHGGGLDLGGGLRAKPVAQGSAYRVFLLVAGGP